MQLKQILLLVQFYERHNQRINDLLTGSSNSQLPLEIVSQALPIVKKYYPDLNSDGFLDDAYTTLQALVNG